MRFDGRPHDAFVKAQREAESALSHATLGGQTLVETEALQDFVRRAMTHDQDVEIFRRACEAMQRQRGAEPERSDADRGRNGNASSVGSSFTPEQTREGLGCQLREPSLYLEVTRGVALEGTELRSRRLWEFRADMGAQGANVDDGLGGDICEEADNVGLEPACGSVAEPSGSSFSQTSALVAPISIQV